MGGPSDSSDTRVYDVHDPLEANNSRDKTIEASEPIVTFSSDALTVSSPHPIEKNDIAVSVKPDVEATQGKGLVQEEVMVNVNPSKLMVTDEDHPQNETIHEKGIYIYYLSLHYSCYSFIYSYVLNPSFIFDPAAEEELPVRQDPIAIPPMGHGKIFSFL